MLKRVQLHCTHPHHEQGADAINHEQSLVTHHWSDQPSPEQAPEAMATTRRGTEGCGVMRCDAMRCGVLWRGLSGAAI